MDDCIFCRIVAGTAPSWKVHETEAAYAFLDIHPVNAYHTLVIPKRHYADLFTVPATELLDIIAALKDVVDMYHTRLGMRNLQVVNSSGPVAQQDVFHLHFHVVPRYPDDGQDVRWTPRLELVEQFPAMLARLQL